jgi:hypothetical protein
MTGRIEAVLDAAEEHGSRAFSIYTTGDDGKPVRRKTTISELISEVRPDVPTLARLRIETLFVAADRLVKPKTIRDRILADPKTAEAWPCVSQGGHPAWGTLRTLQAVANSAEQGAGIATAQQWGHGEWPASVAPRDAAKWLLDSVRGEWRKAQKAAMKADEDHVIIVGTSLEVPSGDAPENLSADDIAHLLAAYRRATEASSFNVPTAILTGPGALTPMFGKQQKSLKKRVKRNPDNSVKSVAVSRYKDGPQLEIFTEELEIKNPTAEESFAAVAHVLTNAEFRLLMACFAMAQDDEAADRTTRGAFWHTPRRMNSLLGRAQHPDTSRRMRRMLDGLATVGIRATIRSGGETFSIDGSKLIYSAHAKMTAEHLPGRPKAHLLRINDVLMKIADAGGGYFCRMPVATLKPPPGVDQRTWDDAYKIYVLLTAHARTNARKARDGGRWHRKLEELMLDAGVESPVPETIARPDHARKRRDQHRHRCLGALVAAGLLVFDVAPNRKGEAVLRYDMPQQRETLATIREPPAAKKPHGKTIVSGSKTGAKPSCRDPETIVSGSKRSASQSEAESANAT